MQSELRKISADKFAVEDFLVEYKLNAELLLFFCC